jgi:hypothetical protein
MLKRLNEENLEDQSQETEEELKSQEQEEISIEQLVALTNLNNKIRESKYRIVQNKHGAHYAGLVESDKR